MSKRLTLKQLKFIKKAQSFGFSLDEIKRILSLQGRGKETCRRVIAMADATLVETEIKLKELQFFRDSLKKRIRTWKKVSKKRRAMGAEFCELIEISG